MTWWQILLGAWLALALIRFLWFAGKSAYLLLVRAALLDYHRSVAAGTRSGWENWLRSQRINVQSLLYESGIFEEGPSPSLGGRATKLNVYALESLEHWLSEHPQGMTRTRDNLARAIRIYFVRAVRGLNPFFWVSWLLFFPNKVAARVGVAGDPEWSASLRLLYWTALAGAVLLFVIFVVRK